MLVLRYFKYVEHLGAANVHTNTDRLSDHRVSGCVCVWVGVYVSDSVYGFVQNTITIVPAAGDVAKNSTFTTEVTSGRFNLHLVDRVG